MFSTWKKFEDKVGKEFKQLDSVLDAYKLNDTVSAGLPDWLIVFKDGSILYVEVKHREYNWFVLNTLDINIERRMITEDKLINNTVLITYRKDIDKVEKVHYNNKSNKFCRVKYNKLIDIVKEYD